MANVIPFRPETGVKPAQVSDLPTLPVRSAVLEMWLSGASGSEIARRLDVDKVQIRRVLRTYQEIHRRQAQLSRVRFKFDLESQFRAIEIEEWKRTERDRPLPPTTGLALLRKAAA